MKKLLTLSLFVCFVDKQHPVVLKIDHVDTVQTVSGKLLDTALTASFPIICNPTPEEK